MSLGATMFNSQWIGLPAARCKLRVEKRDIFARCLCGAVSTVRMDTDQGVTETVTGSVKILVADWTIAPAKTEGLKVEFARIGSEDWKPYRIAGVSETDGVYSFIIEAEFA